MRLPVISGRQAIVNLVRICFRRKRTRGSHTILQRNKLTIVIPLHEELSKGGHKNHPILSRKIEVQAR